MTVFKVVGVALVAVAASLVLRAYRPELGLQIAVAAGVLILVLTLDELAAMSGFLGDVLGRFQIDTGYLKVMLKVIGVAYLAQFAADLCRDAGEGAVAGKVELAGRVLILALCLPVLAAILELVGSILSTHAAA
jgi:stage III sporulation protein AD